MNDQNTHRVISGTSHDRTQWDRFYEAASGLRETVNRYDGQIPHAEGLAEDLFRALYQPLPELRHGDPEIRLTEHLVAAAQKLPDFQQLRSETVNNALSAIFATGSLVDTAVPRLLENKRLAEAAREAARARAAERAATEEARFQSGMERAMKVAAERDELGSGYKEELRRAADAHRFACEQEQRYADEARQQAEHTEAAMATMLDELGPEIRNAMRAGIAAAEGTVAEVGDITDLLDIPGAMHGSGGSSAALDLEEVIRLVEQARSLGAIKDLVRMLGRIDALAARARESKRDSDSGTLHSYKNSGDISRMAGMSRLYYANPQTRDTLWAAQFADAQLTTHSTRDQVKTGRGPVIVALDRSGSMGMRREGALLGPSTRAEMATAIAVGVVRDCAKTGRDCAIVQFADRTWLDMYPAGKAEPGRLLGLLLDSTGADLGGGTDYGAWIGTVRAQLGAQGFEQADVLVVTDVSHPNECAVQPDELLRWQAFRKQSEVRVFTVVVGKGRERYDQAMLAALTDSALFLDDAGDEREAIEQLLARV